MKILIATGMYPPDIGGPATYSKLLSDELPKRGIVTDVLSFSTVRRLPKVVRHIVFSLKLLWHARAADVIFAQDTVSVGLPSLVSAFVLGKALMVRIPGDHAWEQSVQRFGVMDTIDDFQKKKYGFRTEYLRYIQRFVVGHSDIAIAPSKYFAVLANGWVKSQDKVIPIYNGVDLSEIVKLKSAVPFTPRTIISAGRLVPWKGFAMLIVAMKKLDGWKLEIVGDGPEMSQLNDLIAKLGLESRVALLGRIDRGELIGKISQAEIFALNTSFESFSFQIVEAMAVGTPVITTRVGDLPEIITDGREGILIAPDDETGFIAAVKRISTDQSFRKGLVGAAIAKAGSFSIGATVSAVEKAATGLVNSPSPLRKKKATAAKLIRYLFSGGTAAATDLILLYILTDVFGIWYVLSSVLAFLVAFVVSFILQKFFTFQDHGMDGVHGQALLYLLVTGGNLAINTGLIYILVHYGGLHYLLSQVLTSIAIAIESFIIYRMFIFAPSSPKRP